MSPSKHNDHEPMDPEELEQVIKGLERPTLLKVFTRVFRSDEGSGDPLLLKKINSAKVSVVNHLKRLVGRK